MINTSLNDDQRTAYNNLVKFYKDAGEESEAEGSQTQPVNSFRVSKTKLLLGAFAAGILYIIIYLAYCIASGRIHNAVSLKAVSGIRNIGEWYSTDRKSSFWKKFTGTKALYKRQHRSHMDENAEINKMIDTITSVAKHSDVNRLLVSVNEGADQTGRDFADKLVDKLNSIGLKTSVCEVNCKKDLTIDESALAETDSVIIAVDHDKTHINDIRDICEKCAYYNVPVLGSIYLG